MIDLILFEFITKCKKEFVKTRSFFNEYTFFNYNEL